MMKWMSHHSLWSEAESSADTVAQHACVAVFLTHLFYIWLGYLQNQTQLLVEQQLQDCAAEGGIALVNPNKIQFVAGMCEV